MKIGDLVKINSFGSRQLDHMSKFCGIVVQVQRNIRRLDEIELVYVSWPDKPGVHPISVRWLEGYNEAR